jgi:hypothetical protein
VAVTKGLGKAGEAVGEAAAKAGKAAKTALDKIPLPEPPIKTTTEGFKSRQRGAVNFPTPKPGALKDAFDKLVRTFSWDGFKSGAILGGD